METIRENQDYPGTNHPKTPSLQNEELAPPGKSLGFRFCTYLVLFSFFFQTLWPSVAFAHVDVPLGAAWRDAASGLTFTVQPFKDPTTHRNLVRLQAQINSKEEWAEQDVTPAKAPAPRVVPSSSLPAADNLSEEPLKTPLNPSDVARSALEEKLKTVLDRIVDIEALQPIPSSSTQIPYSDLSVTEDGIQWGFGGLSFLLDWNWNVLSSGRAEFDMALKVCTLGTVELDKLFVKQVLAKGRDVLHSGRGRIDRLDAWATGIQGVHARPGIVQIAKDSEQRFRQIFIHQGRGESFGNLHIEESLNQTEEFQNNSHMHMDKGASVKGGSVFTNTATMEGESYSVQSALIRNEGTGDQKAVMTATESLTLVAPKLEQKGLLKSPEVDLLGVQQIEDSVDSLIDVDLLKTQLAQTWTQTGTIDAGEWQDTSAYEVFIQNKGGIKTYNETSISARFRTLQGGKSDLSGVSLLNPLDKDQPLENEGKTILRRVKDLGARHKDVHNKAGATLVFLDSKPSPADQRDGTASLGAVTNRGHIFLERGSYPFQQLDNTDGVLRTSLLSPDTGCEEEWELDGTIIADLISFPRDLVSKITNRAHIRCGQAIVDVGDGEFLSEMGSEFILGDEELSPGSSSFQGQTFTSKGSFQALVPVTWNGQVFESSGPMSLMKRATITAPHIETGDDFTALACTLDGYWHHRKGIARIAKFFSKGNRIKNESIVSIEKMPDESRFKAQRIAELENDSGNADRPAQFRIGEGIVEVERLLNRNGGKVFLEEGECRVGYIENPESVLTVDWFFPLDNRTPEWVLTGTVAAKHLFFSERTGISKVIIRGKVLCGEAQVEVGDVLSEVGSEVTLGVAALEPGPSSFTVKTFLSQGKFQSSVPVKLTAEKSIKIPGPMTLEQPSTFKTPILETGADFITRASLTLEDCYWTHQRGQADIAELLFGGKDISAYGDVLIRQMDGFALILYSRHNSTIPVLNVGRGHRFHIQKGGAVFGKISNYGVTVLEDGTYRFTKLEGPGTLEADWLIPEGSQDLDFTGDFYGSPGTIHAKNFSTYVFKGSKITTGGSTTFDYADINVDTLANKGAGSQLTISSGTSKVKVLDNEADIVLNGSSKIVTDALHNSRGTIQSPNGNLRVLMLDQGQSPQTSDHNNPTVQVAVKGKIHDIHPGTFKAKDDLIVETAPCLDIAEFLRRYGEALQCGGLLRLYGDIFRARNPLTYPGAAVITIRDLEVYNHLIFRSIAFEAKRALFGKNSFLETRPNAKRPEDDTSLKVESEETLDARKAKMFSHSTLELESTDGDLLVAERGKVIRNIGPYGPSGTFVQGYSKNGSWLASNKDMSLIAKNLRLLYAEITSHGKLFLGAEKLVESVGSNIFAKTSIRIKAEEFSHRIAHSGAVDSGMWCASVPIKQLKTGYMYFPQSDPALLSTLGNLYLNVLNFTIYGSKILVGDSIIRGRQSWQGETGCPFIKADAIKNHQSYHDVMADYFMQVGGSSEMDWGPQHFLSQVQAGKKIRMSSQNMQDSGYVSGNDLKLSLDRALFEFLGRVVDDIQKEVEKHGTLSISWFIEGSQNGFIQEKTDGSLGYAVPMIEDGASSIEASALPVAGQTSLGVSPSVIFRVQRGSSLEKRGIMQMMAAGMGRIYTLKDFSFDNVVDRLLRNGQEAHQSGALMDPRAIQYHKAFLFFHLQKMHDARTLEEKIKAFLTLYIPPSMRQAPEMGAVRGQDTCDVQIEEYIESIGGEFSAQGEGAKVNMTGPGNGVFKPAVKWQGDMADGGQQIEKRTTFNGQDAVNVELDEIDTYAISGKAGKGGVHLKARTRHEGHAVPLQSVQSIREGRKTVRIQEVNHAVDEIETTGKTTHSNESGPVILTAPRVKAKDGSAIIGQGIHVAHVQNERLVEISEKSGGGGGLFGGRETERRLQTGAYTAQGAVFESDNPLTMIDTAGVGITLDKITVRCPKTVLISLGGIVQLLQGEELHTSLLSEKCSDPFWQSIRQRAEQHRTYSSSEFSGPIEVHARQLIVEEVCGQALSFKDQIDLKTGEMSIRYLEELHQVVECRAQGPTAALAAVIALAATIAAIASGGAAAAGAMAVQATATTGMTASIISAMGYAGFISVCAQTAVALGNNKMNIGRAAQDLASTQSLKALLLAMAAAGVVAGASQFLGTPATAADATARATDQASQAAVASNPPPIPSMPQVPPPVPTLPQSVQSSLSQHLQFNLVNAGASAALDMVINGTSPRSDLKGKLLNVGVNTLAATAANTIAFSLNEGFIDKFGQFMCHLGVGAGIGAAVRGRDGFADGIIFAGIAEGIASLAKDDPAVLKAKATAKAQDQGLEPTRKNLSTFVKDELRKVVDIGRLGTAVFSLFARKDVDLAARIATNALEHNFSKSELEACLDAYTNVALDQVQEDEDFVRDASDAAVDEANKSLEERAEKTPIGKAHKAVKDGVKEGVKAGAKAVGLDRLADAVSDHIDLDGLRDAASSHADRVGQGASGYAASKIEQVEALRGPLSDEQRSFLQQEFEYHHAEDAFARDMMNVAADGVALLFTLPGKAAEAVLNQTNLTSDATAHALGNLTNDAVALVGGAMDVKQAFKAGAAGLGKQTLGKPAPRFPGLAAANAKKAPVFMTPSANRNLADAIGHRMQATGTHGPAPSFATRMMAKDDSFLPRSAGGLGRSEGLGTSGVSGAGLGRDAPRPSAPKSAVKSQGEVPKKVRFEDDVSAKNASLHQKYKAELELQHNTSLSEAQLIEPGKIIAGEGAKDPFKHAAKFASDYGGSAEDWVKKTSMKAFTKDGRAFETHWVENLITSQRLQYKIKFTGVKK